MLILGGFHFDTCFSIGFFPDFHSKTRAKNHPLDRQQRLASQSQMKGLFRDFLLKTNAISVVMIASWFGGEVDPEYIYI